MPATFAEFLKFVPPERGSGVPLGGPKLAKAVKKQFGIPVPDKLVEFWSEVGAGYFADRELYVFGDQAGAPRNTTKGAVGLRTLTG